MIPAGKTTAIIGESGSGKSTLANLLLRLYDPQEGTITIDGQPLRTCGSRATTAALAAWARTLSSSIRRSDLTSPTAAANPPSDERVIAAAKQACAHDFIMELPDGYDTMIGDRGVRLSGGQRQRLALARAILCRPRDPDPRRGHQRARRRDRARHPGGPERVRSGAGR